MVVGIFQYLRFKFFVSNHLSQVFNQTDSLEYISHLCPAPVCCACFVCLLSNQLSVSYLLFPLGSVWWLALALFCSPTSAMESAESFLPSLQRHQDLSLWASSSSSSTATTSTLSISTTSSTPSMGTGYSLISPAVSLYSNLNFSSALCGCGCTCGCSSPLSAENVKESQLQIKWWKPWSLPFFTFIHIKTSSNIHW